MANHLVNKLIIKLIFSICRFSKYKFVIFYLLFSFLIPNKINFSANSLETIIEDDIEKQIFKDNVVINKNNMQLFTDKAIYYPDKNEVLLINNVKMYDTNDSLFCDSLILYDEEQKSFEAMKNVNFYKQTNKIKCEKLIYETLPDTSKKIIQIFDNGKIIDSLRVVKGDSIYIHYKDSLLDHINISSNGEIINYRYAKINKNKRSQLIEDYISSKYIYMDFYNSSVKNIYLKGMSTTKLNVVQDTLIQGLNKATGDSISINMNNNIIDRLQIIGGAEGTFIPEKNNSKIDSTIVYKAEYIDYLVNEEVSYLINDAYVNYDFTELNSGKIYVDWNNNFLEATIQDSIFPSINGFGENPTFGDKMIFNLVTKRGKIFKGKTKYNEGNYLGENIIRDKDEVLYVSDSQFSTCDLDDPHYFFHSDYMKMIPEDRIIAKPVLFYIQELPIFYLPFAVFPNKNGNRISGWIMPSFGHRNTSGTYLDDLGYYYVPNDYSDYRMLVDIQDKKGIITNQLLRYKRKSGKYWYNYYLDGSFEYEKKYYLSDEDNDITNLFNEDTRIYENVKWRHKQSFDPTQDLIINYKYKSTLDPQESNFNERLDQNQLTTLSYQKRWERNSLNIGFEKYEELYIPLPSGYDQINVYKWLTGPRLSFSMPQRKLFGNGDSWYNKIYINYGVSYNNGKETFTKNSCLDINNDNICDPCLEFDDEGTCLDYGECNEFDDNGNCTQYIWSSEDSEDISSGGAKNNIQLSSTNSIGFITISPRLNIIEDWVFQYRDYNLDGEFIQEDGFNRRLTWNSSLILNTKLYGILPVNLGGINSIRHKITPAITFNYIPDLKTGSDQIVNDYDILNGTSASSLSNGSQNIRFSIDNNFQMKIKDQYGEINKIDFLNYYLTFNYGGYNGEENKFSLIDSKISFKKPNGTELLYVHMQHDMYNENDQLLIKENKLPRLSSLTAQMSSFFRINGRSFDNNSILVEQPVDESDTLDFSKYNSILYMDEQKPNISSNELWRSDLSFSIQGNYDVEEEKWDFNYFNLDTRTTLHLTKKWLLTYAVGVNLMDMKIKSQSFKFYRDLHCWEFMFTWWPDGFGKGFQLSINIKHPDLQDIRLRSSSPNRKFMTN